MGLALAWYSTWIAAGAGSSICYLGKALSGTASALSAGCRGELLGGEEPGWMSEQDRLLQEVQNLRLDVAALAHRVLVLEGQQNTSAVPGSPVTVNYSFPVGAVPYPEPSTPPRVTSASDSSVAPLPLPSSTTSERHLAAYYFEEERRRAAISVGRFFSRCLSGEHRGSSEKVNLPSRVYVLCRDINNITYNPVKVFTNFSSLKPFVKPHGFCGDSIFAGLPSLWEAKLAVGAAELDWPSEAASARHGAST